LFGQEVIDCIGDRSQAAMKMEAYVAGNVRFHPEEKRTGIQANSQQQMLMYM